MHIIKPMVVIEDDLDMLLPNGNTLAKHSLKKIELFTRKCYKSEGKMTDESYKEFVPRIFNTRKHEGIIEHRTISVTFITDRGVSHEGVRHRMASYLQESTRYVDYSGRGLAFIQPPWVYPGHPDWNEFVEDCYCDEVKYNKWRARGWTPEKSRYFLYTGIKTEYAATLNFGAWMNFLRKRLPSNVHPQMRQISVPLLRYFKERVPEIFGHMEVPELGYEEAKLIVNPYYDQVEFEEVPLNGQNSQ